MGRTVAIIDFAHSGTTMLSGLCHILGVPMVFERYKLNKLEDWDVIETIRREKQFAQLVDRRNRQYASWGFKLVGAWKFPKSLVHLRDPLYLAIYKDPVSVTGRRFGAISFNKLDNTLEQMRLSVQGIMDSGLPVRVLSYQRAINSPEVFVTELGEILGVEVGDRLPRATEFIRPNRGRMRKPYPEVDSWI